MQCCWLLLVWQRQVLILVREIPSHSRAGGNPLKGPLISGAVQLGSPARQARPTARLMERWSLNPIDFDRRSGLAFEIQLERVDFVAFDRLIHQWVSVEF